MIPSPAGAACGTIAGMSLPASLHVLEFNRSDDGVWNLPGEFVDRLRTAFPSVRFSAPATQAEADALLPEADIVFGWAVRSSNFEHASKLGWIQVSAAGIGGLLFPAMVESDIVITNGRGLHAASMAEHTLGVMLMFVRNLHLARDAQLRSQWAQDELFAGGPEFRELPGTTMGLVGLGQVGSAIARGARVLGVRVIAVRKHPQADAAADEQWGPERLDELFGRADWLVLVPALTPETRGLADARRIALMKPGAVLINLGRGALVDEVALIAALEGRRIAGASLDVTGEEPLPPDSPRWKMPNVILTPHISGLGPRYWQRSIELFQRNLAAWIERRPLENVVDKRAGY